MPPEESDKEASEAPRPSEPEPAETAAPEVTPPEVQAPAESPPPTPEPQQPAGPEPSPPREPMRPAVDYSAIGNQAKKRKREARLEKLLAYAREKGRVTNDEIQKLLRVSDATATRYARELVTRGLLKQVGKGRSAYYQI